jgi:ABC-type spermidine/putrescine transport system permease subunit II
LTSFTKSFDDFDKTRFISPRLKTFSTSTSMTSTSTQNPSLTYMAMTARAADYAVKEMKKGNL